MDILRHLVIIVIILLNLLQRSKAKKATKEIAAGQKDSIFTTTATTSQLKSNSNVPGVNRVSKESVRCVVNVGAHDAAHTFNVQEDIHFAEQQMYELPVSEEGNIRTIALSSTIPSVATIIAAIIGVRCWCKRRGGCKEIFDKRDSDDVPQDQLVPVQSEIQASGGNAVALHNDKDIMYNENIALKDCKAIVFNVHQASNGKEAARYKAKEANNFIDNSIKKCVLIINNQCGDS